MLEVPREIIMPEWVRCLCQEAHRGIRYYLYAIDIDFEYPSRKNRGFIWRHKMKKLMKKKDKTHDDYLKLIQIATHFHLKSDSVNQDILYDSTTDFFTDL